MAPKWPKINSGANMTTTTQRAIHLKTYCTSTWDHYEKHKQSNVSSEIILQLIRYVQDFCNEILELKLDARLDEVVAITRDARDSINYIRNMTASFTPQTNTPMIDQGEIRKL